MTLCGKERLVPLGSKFEVFYMDALNAPCFQDVILKSSSGKTFSVNRSVLASASQMCCDVMLDQNSFDNVHISTNLEDRELACLTDFLKLGFLPTNADTKQLDMSVANAFAALGIDLRLLSSRTQAWQETVDLILKLEEDSEPDNNRDESTNYVDEQPPKSPVTKARTKVRRKVQENPKELTKSPVTKARTRLKRNDENINPTVAVKKCLSDKPFACTKCERRFASRSDLRRHDLTHTGEKPFGCTICNRYFSTKCALTRHVGVHNGAKPYSCKYCSKAFRNTDCLARHERIHTGERPYSCKICQKSFAVSKSLRVHERTHSGDKPYQCTNCNMSFRQWHHLRGHVRSQQCGKVKSFVCQICHKGFVSPSYLKTHKRAHKDKRSFKCKKCGKSFTVKSGVREHEKKYPKCDTNVSKTGVQVPKKTVMTSIALASLVEIKEEEVE